MLAGKFSLYEVDDVEALCAKVIQQSRLELAYHDHEDALAYLVETAWEISLSYEPSDPPRFAVHLRGLLKKRIIDWQRQRSGRTKWQFRDRVYERPRVTVSSLDQLDRTLSEGSVEDPLPSDPALLRILRPRGGEGTRQDSGVGRSGTRRAA